MAVLDSFYNVSVIVVHPESPVCAGFEESAEHVLFVCSDCLAHNMCRDDFGKPAISSTSMRFVRSLGTLMEVAGSSIWKSATQII